LGTDKTWLNQFIKHYRIKAAGRLNNPTLNKHACCVPISVKKKKKRENEEMGSHGWETAEKLTSEKTM